jgi:hypothetical protein
VSLLSADALFLKMLMSESWPSSISRTARLLNQQQIRGAAAVHVLLQRKRPLSNTETFKHKSCWKLGKTADLPLLSIAIFQSNCDWPLLAQRQQHQMHRKQAEITPHAAYLGCLALDLSSTCQRSVHLAHCASCIERKVFAAALNAKSATHSF